VLRYCDDHIGTLNTDETNRITIELVSSELDGGYAADGNAVIDESVLSAENLSDQKDGANGNETFMHEIVHLFLGDLGLPFDDDGLWSCEGMTVYTTYRIVKEKYGALYAKKYYSDVWEEVVKKQNNNFYLRNPGYLDKLPESYRNSILSSIGTDNRYCRMPLMLLKAEQILGEEKMDAVIQELYARRNEYYMNGGCCTFEDFLNAAGLEKEDLEL
jgi:aminopeptidase N